MDLVATWYRKRLSPWLWPLAPLSLLYWVVTGLRRWGFSCGLLASRRVPVPVIVVGNITVGGTGKTPLVIALAEQLAVAGYRPGIASRGYGANPPLVPFLVTADKPASQCGDEPLLLSRRTGLPVVIDPDRPAACRYLTDHCDCDVIISDDGLQHYRMQRDIEIVVLDGSRGVGNGMLLPMGPLREPVSRLDKVDAIVVNGADSVVGVGHAPAHAMSIAATQLVALESGNTIDTGSWNSNKKVHAVAGIGNPQRFFDSLRALGFTPIEHSFADHHRFSSDDIRFDDELPVIMTEKDAVKCAQLAPGERYWYLKVDAELPAAFFERVLQRLRQLKAAR